jgi:hypothetical protein
MATNRIAKNRFLYATLYLNSETYSHAFGMPVNFATLSLGTKPDPKYNEIWNLANIKFQRHSLQWEHRETGTNRFPELADIDPRFDFGTIPWGTFYGPSLGEINSRPFSPDFVSVSKLLVKIMEKFSKTWGELGPTVKLNDRDELARTIAILAHMGIPVDIRWDGKPMPAPLPGTGPTRKYIAEKTTEADSAPTP